MDDSKPKSGTSISLAVFLVIAWWGHAGAHTFPVRSEPKVGATVSTAPTAVRIWFDDKLKPGQSRVAVYDKTRKRVDKGNARISPSDATMLEVGLPSLAPGIYRVYWTAVSSRDRERTRGDFQFRITRQ